MIKMVIPTSDDIEKSKVFNIIGRRAPVSDVAIATGVYVNDSYYIEGDNSLKERSGWYWNKDKYDYTSARAVYWTGLKYYSIVYARSVGVRPALEFSSIEDLTNAVSGELEDFKGIKRGKLYVPLHMGEKSQKELQKLLEEGKMKQLPRDRVTFPTDSNKYKDYYKPFTKKNNSYYEYNGNLYLLLDVNTCYDGKQTKFNNGEYYRDGDRIFLEVKEAYVYFDEQEKTEDGNYIAYFNNMLFSGVPFNHTGKYPENFDKSDIGIYLDVYWRELKKLQQVIKEMNKSQSELETNPENNVLNTTDSSIHKNTTPIESTEQSAEEIPNEGTEQSAEEIPNEGTEQSAEEIAIESTEQSAEEIANESTVSNEMRIDKIIDYFNNLKKQSIKLDTERIELIKKLDIIEAKKAEITKTIKEVEALIGKEGVGRDE